MITYEQYKCLINKQKEIESAILNGEAIAGKIWEEIIGELDTIAIESDMNNAGRWSVPEDYIFKLDGRFFCVWCDRGLTEYQEDEWEDQAAVEVRPKQITITTWEAVDND